MVDGWGNHNNLCGLSEIKREVLNTKRIGQGVRLPQHMIDNMTVHETKVEVAQEILVQFETYIAEQSHTETRIAESRRFPLDWFEHFKERWFPLFVLTKYPVKYKVIDTKVEMTTNNMYPHITIPHPAPRHITITKFDKMGTPNWR